MVALQRLLQVSTNPVPYHELIALLKDTGEYPSPVPEAIPLITFGSKIAVVSQMLSPPT